MWANHYWVQAAAETTTALSSGEILQTILSAVNLGVLGIVFWLFVRGQLHSSEEMDHEREARLKAEEQRDDALKVAREQLVPALVAFNATMAALVPLLQEMVRGQEDRGERNPRRR